jgi:hypothetical protein
MVKQSSFKTKIERQFEIINMRNKILDLGVSPENPGIIEFNSVSNDFIETGKEFTGKFNLIGFKRVLVVNYKNKKGILCISKLEHNPDI